MVDQLTDENDHLLAVIDQLEEQKAEVVKLNESIERGIRQEMTDYLMTELRRKEQSVEARLQVKIDFLTKTHAEDVSTQFSTKLHVVFKNSFLFSDRRIEIEIKKT